MASSPRERAQVRDADIGHGAFAREPDNASLEHAGGPTAAAASPALPGQTLATTATPRPRDPSRHPGALASSPASRLTSSREKSRDFWLFMPKPEVDSTIFSEPGVRKDRGVEMNAQTQWAFPLGLHNQKFPIVSLQKMIEILSS